jgi:hypothetical protein
VNSPGDPDGIQEVDGSIPFSSTNKFKRLPTQLVLIDLQM